MIHILHERATPAQVQEMLAEYESMIEIVVDIRRQVEAITLEILGGVW